MSNTTRYFIVATFEPSMYGSRVINAELMTAAQVQKCNDPSKAWVEGPYYGKESAEAGLAQYKLDWVC